MSDFVQAWDGTFRFLGTREVPNMSLAQVKTRFTSNKKTESSLIAGLEHDLIRELSRNEARLSDLSKALSQVLGDSSIASQVDEICLTASSPSDPPGDLKVTITREKFDPDYPFLVVVQFFPFAKTTRAVLAQFGRASMFQVDLRIDPKTGSYRELMMSMDGCDL